MRLSDRWRLFHACVQCSGMTNSSLVTRQAITVHLTDSLLLLQERLQALQEERKKVIEEADSPQPKAKSSGAEVQLDLN